MRLTNSHILYFQFGPLSISQLYFVYLSCYRLESFVSYSISWHFLCQSLVEIVFILYSLSKVSFVQHGVHQWKKPVEAIKGIVSTPTILKCIIKWGSRTMKKYFFSSELDLNLKISILATIGPGGLRAPCIAWPLLLPSFSLFFSFFFLSLLLLLLTHFGESPVCENLFPPIFWHN